MEVGIVRSTNLISYASGSTAAARVSQATQVKSQFPDKKDTLVFQVKAWALGWHPYSIKNKPTEKKKIKIEFTTRQMLRIQAENGQGLLGMKEDYSKPRSTTDCSASGGGAGRRHIIPLCSLW